MRSGCLRVLENALDQAAPWDLFRVSREMSVVLGPEQRPEPDLIVVHAEAEVGPQATWYPADAVVLAVEVVSPESRIRESSTIERHSNCRSRSISAWLTSISSEGQGQLSKSLSKERSPTEPPQRTHAPAASAITGPT